MSKKKPNAPNWAKIASPANGPARAATPVARAGEALHRAVTEFLAQPELHRLGEFAPIEVELRTPRECARSGCVHVAVERDGEQSVPTGLVVTTGPSGFQQLVAWIYGRTDDFGEEGPPLVLRDAQIMGLAFLPARELPARERRAQIGEAIVLDGVPCALLAQHLTHRRVGLTPDVEELQVLTEVVDALTRALEDPAFEALPYSFSDATCTRLGADGRVSGVAWPELTDEVRDSLHEDQGGDLWDEVDEATRLGLAQRACALAGADGEGHDRTLVITALGLNAVEPDAPKLLVFLEAGTLRELARREIGPLTDPVAALVRGLGGVLDVLQGRTEGGPNAWPGGAPKHVIHELMGLHRPLMALLGEARSVAGLGYVDVEHSATDQAAGRYLFARERLARPGSAEGVEPLQLAGALAFIEHRSEHVESGGEDAFFTFLDHESAENELIEADQEEGLLGALRSFRILLAVADGGDEPPWLPALMAAGELPGVLERGFAAWSAAAPDFYLPEANGTTFRALGAGTTGVRIDVHGKDELPDLDDHALPLWRASLDATERFVPAGAPVSAELAREILAQIEAQHGSLDDAARRAGAALLVRRTFVA